VPQNVRIYRDIPAKDFYNLMAGAQAVIVPLKIETGSSGQMVALAAMQFAKTVIYPNNDTISQYFQNGTTGLMYKTDDTESLLNQLDFVTTHIDKINQIGESAKKTWELYYKRKNFEDVLIGAIITFFSKGTV
jgi:glycosyltransferase involved in cell wall biosynthesis